MEEFVAYIIMNLVSKPDSVRVKTVETQRGLTVEVRLNKNDIGRVVGHKGKTIQALRTITSIIGVRLQCRIQIEIIEGETEEEIATIVLPETQAIESGEAPTHENPKDIPQIDEMIESDKGTEPALVEAAAVEAAELAPVS